MASYGVMRPYGLPGFAAMQDTTRTDFGYGARRDTILDINQLEKLGLGQSVGAAFSPGTRAFQNRGGMVRALLQGTQANAQFGEQQYQFDQEQAYKQDYLKYLKDQANKGLLGGVLGNILRAGTTLAPLFIPGLQPLAVAGAVKQATQVQ